MQQAAVFSRLGTFIWMPMLALLLFSLSARAQKTQAGTPSSSNAAPTTASASPKQVPHHKKRHRSAKTIHQKAADQANGAPAAPALPVPPAEQTARPATVNFSQGNLSIDAQNASLVQTLNQVSHLTGLTVEGLSHDQRIYGQYGPGPVASTLTSLLDGKGYDYVIVGGGGGQTPTKLLLTPSSGAAGAAATPPVPGNGAPTANPAENPEPTENVEPDNSEPTDSSEPTENSEPPQASEPTQPKTPQEIFNELRRMHPQ